GREPAMTVAAVHRVCARSERLALAAAVRRIAGVLAVDPVRRDGQYTLRVGGIAGGRVLADLGPGSGANVRGAAGHRGVVVAELGNRIGAVEFGPIVDGQSGVVADDVDLGVFDGSQAVGDD